MFEELIKYNLSEKLDKQIVDRLPYFLFISLIFYLLNGTLTHTFAIQLIPVGYIPYIFIVCLAITLLLTHFFNKEINMAIERDFDYSDFGNITNKISQIFEKDESLLSDIKKSFGLNKKNIWIGLLSGLFLLFSFYLMFYMLIDKLSPDLSYLVIGLGITGLYIYQDTSKLDYFKSEGSSNPFSSFIEDLLETYTVKNTVRSIPISKSFTESLFYLMSKLCGPLIYSTLPKFSFETLMIYDTVDFRDYLNSLSTTAPGAQSLHLVKSKAQNESNLLDGNTKGKQKVSLLLERSPRENFPFLFKSNTANQLKPSWQSWYIQEVDKKVGCIILTGYRGAFVKRAVKKAKNDIVLDKRVVYHILIIGERAPTEYLKSQISIRAPAFNPNMLAYEIDE